MRFFEQIASEWPLIAQAPLTFTLLIIAALAAAYALARLHYGREIATLNTIIRQKDNEIGDWKRKTEGGTPDEAKARLEELERGVAALRPRRLTDSQRVTLRNALMANPGRIAITRDGNAADAYPFVMDLQQTFIGAGWQTSQGMALGLGRPPLTGIALHVVNPAALTPKESCVAEAFRAAGFEYDLQTRGADPDRDVEILISARLN